MLRYIVATCFLLLSPPIFAEIITESPLYAFPSMARLQGHSDAVNDVAYSPDDSRLISVSSDGHIKVWSATTATELFEFDKKAVVIDFDFSPDGQFIATGSFGGIDLWQVDSGTKVSSLKVHDSTVISLAYSSDGQRLVSSAFFSDVAKVSDVSSGAELLTLAGHTGAVTAVAYSPSGQQIASASEDKTIKLWRADSGQLWVDLIGHTRDVKTLAYAADGSRLVSGGFDKTIRVWDTQLGQLLSTYTATFIIKTLAYSPDGTRIVAAGLANQALVLDAQTHQVLLNLEGHGNYINKIAYSPDNQHIVTASDDNTMKIWQANDGHIQHTLGNSHEINTLAISPDENLLVSGGADGQLKLWQAQTGKLLNQNSAHEAAVMAVAFSPDGNRIASASQDGKIKIFSASDLQRLLTLSEQQQAVRSLAYSPDGSQVVSGGADYKVRLWDANSGQALATFSGHDKLVAQVAFSHDGQTVASASWDKTVKVWHLGSRQNVFTLTGHSDLVGSVAYSHDDQWLVSGSDAGEVFIWDMQSGQLVSRLEGISDNITDVAYAHDDQTLFVANDALFGYSGITIFDVQSGQQVRQLAHDNSTQFVLASQTKRLYSAGTDRRIQAWLLDPNIISANTCESCIQMQLNEKRYQQGDNFKLSMTLNGNTEVDSYVAIIFPNGQFITLSPPLAFSEFNQIQPYQTAMLPEADKNLGVLDLGLPQLPAGHYQTCGILVTAGNTPQAEHWLHQDCVGFGVD